MFLPDIIEKSIANLKFWAYSKFIILILIIVMNKIILR